MRLALFVCATLAAQPRADHHQHLLRSALTPPEGYAQSAAELIRQLDEAKIERAVLLSIAYQFGNPNRPAVANEYERVKAENDWTAEQAAQFPKRLIAFCGVNPLKDYALGEIARCAKDPRLRRGLKLHFGNSDVNMDNPAHVVQLRQVFSEANRHRMAIVAHIRSNYNNRRPWGAQQARVFLDQLLPLAKDVTVQIAHAASAGAFDDEGVEAALTVFAGAIAARDKRMKRVYIDVSMARWESKAESLAKLLRGIGMKRLIYGSDSPPTKASRDFRKLPLSTSELRQIELNVAPYFR